MNRGLRTSGVQRNVSRKLPPFRDRVSVKKTTN